ncbi:hypothetical protein [Streptomyces sp. enrichment culture]|uniref:hypothetical protein n=1 Tax=Streptomyces sp. enrichment culture TaxID=1795815 RepID=UPI003F55C176
MNRKNAIFIAPLSVLSLLLMGCSSSEAAPSGERKLYSLEDVTSEYQAAADELFLPAGFEWIGFSPEEAELFMPGVGTGNAQFEWLCAWQIEWLESMPVDSEAAELALIQLRSALDLEIMTRYLDKEGRDIFIQDLDRAELGDASGVQQDVDVNCAHVERV